MIKSRKAATVKSRENTIKHKTKPYLIFTWGNPSRGDDAIGPHIYEYLIDHPHPDADILTDFQLQIEHSQDLLNREAVIFADANATCTAPYEFNLIFPDQDNTYSTHAMSPQAILSVYQQINHQSPPPAYLLSVKGIQFELGQPLSRQAKHNMQSAIELLENMLQYPQADWSNQLRHQKNPD